MSSKATNRLLGPCAIEFASGKTGAWRIECPAVDEKTCILCGICEKYCPTNAITVIKGKGEDAGLSIMLDYCKGCGICANVCPQKAILMVPEREDFHV